MHLFEQTDPLTDQDLQTFKPALDNLQGNLLKSHGRDHALHIFLTFTGDAAGIRQFLATLGVRHVTSATEQAAQTLRHKHERKDEMFTQVLLSSAGYHYLGLDVSTFDPLFQSGMKAAANRLADPPQANWDPPFRQSVGCLIVLAHDSADALEDREDEIRNAVQSFAHVHVENGQAIHNEDGKVMEHFGYIDGRSQPLFFKSDVDAEPHANWDPSAGPKLILTKDALGTGDDDCGTYFVFRKLEQNVRGFKQREQDLADALGLTGDDRELAGAMMVGRFEDGTPVALHHDAVVHNPGGPPNPIENDFAYPAADPQGNRCPFSGHVRKTNPRGDTNTLFGVPLEDEKAHRIARRGITYGKAKGPSDVIAQNPEGGVGLLFQCCNNSLANQFEFMQATWANNPAFVQDNPGEDPVMGQTHGAFQKGKWPNPWDSANRVAFDVHNFVHLKGGEYFFCPSIPFLKHLAP